MTDMLRMAIERIEALETRCVALGVANEEARQTIADLSAVVKAGTENAARMTELIAGLQTQIAKVSEIVSNNAEIAAEAVSRVVADVDAIRVDVANHRIEAQENAADVVSQLENHRIETATLVSRLRDPLPKSLMIDHAGVLVAVDHTGDTREIGRVVGEPGREAPRIEAAAWKAGHIVLSMSDRTSHLIELPALAGLEQPAPVSGRTPEGDNLKAEIRLGVVMAAAATGKSAKSVAAIAKRYNLQPVTVRAIIRDHEHEAEKRRKNPADQ